MILSKDCCAQAADFFVHSSKDIIICTSGKQAVPEDPLKAIYIYINIKDFYFIFEPTKRISTVDGSTLPKLRQQIRARFCPRLASPPRPVRIAVAHLPHGGSRVGLRACRARCILEDRWGPPPAPAGAVAP
jgi:hypothetical protein